VAFSDLLASDSAALVAGEWRESIVFKDSRGLETTVNALVAKVRPEGFVGEVGPEYLDVLLDKASGLSLSNYKACKVKYPADGGEWYRVKDISSQDAQVWMLSCAPGRR
jgi:hypothetical protein